MRRCPQCNAFFPDTEHFCELDGAPLNDSADTSDLLKNTPKTSNQIFLALLAVGGIAIGGLLVVIYLGLTAEKAPKPSPSASSTPAIMQQRQLPPRAKSQLPDATPGPTLEASPPPSVEPSPSVHPSPAQVKLSTNPISTTHGQEPSGPVTIELASGVRIEADEAWQTGEGIWYRKHGVVSLLDPKSVRAIEKISKAAPQPSASIRSPSP